MISNLVFFLPDSKGGVETFIDNYSNSIQGCNVKVIKYRDINSIIGKTIESGNDRKKLLKIGFSKYATKKSKFKILKGCVSKNDILICNDSFEFGFIEKYKLKNKLIYILHGDLKHYRNILNEYGSFIDLVICVSTGLRNKYSPLYPILKFEISFPFLLKSVVSAEIFRSEKLKCIFIGKFEFLKGADLFLDLVNSCGNSIEFAVAAISDGSEANLLGRISNGVNLFMDLPNKSVLELLPKMDVLIFPSRTEGFGISILESMSRGVMPIVLDIPIGIPDQVIDRLNGFIVKEENWSEVRSILEGLIADRSLLDKMKRNAIKIAVEKFNASIIAENFVNIVENVQEKVNKRFSDHEGLNFEYLPEPVYRILKYLNTKIKYG